MKVKVRVKNIADEAVEYTVWNIGDSPVYTRIKASVGDTITLRAPDDPKFVQPAVTFGTLPPNEEIERQVQWEVGSSSNGVYTLEAS